MDTSLYSRQIYTYGMETMKKITSLKIFIIGLRGLGVETAKNLILAGPKEVCLYDNHVSKINDLSSNFYITENDVKLERKRDEACLEKLRELNHYVKIYLYDEKRLNLNLKQFILNFNAVVITEITNTKDLFEINEICRKNNITFIYGCNFGLTGFSFSDFGDEHIVYNSNGEDPLSYYVKYIINKENTYEIITDDRDDENVELCTGDYVVFKEIKGIPGLNGKNPRKIKLISRNRFSVEKFEGEKNDESNYISDGIVEEIKLPKKMKFLSFKENLYIPYKDEYPIYLDKSKKGSNELLHFGIIGLHEYYDIHNDLPELNNLEQTKEILDICKNNYSNSLKNNEKWIKKIKNFDEKFLENMIRWSKSEINPICAFLGGVLAQEILKSTGLYEPIHQWLRFDFFEAVSHKDIDDCDRKTLNCRYDDQIAIFGNKLQQKLFDKKIFMIGAGALGCEYLKNFALMGISISDKSLITVTDNDNIEQSNLNRQFLFRIADKGKNKSECACREVLKINNKTKCKSLNKKLTNEYDEYFNDEFWDEQDLIIIAVDNVQTRKVIDKKCTFYNKTFIDSGTTGTRASSFVFIPNETCSYRDIPETVEKEIPLCTLKNFPYLIEHCIEWGKNKFHELFDLNIQNLKMMIDDKNKFIEIITKEKDDFEYYNRLNNFNIFINLIENFSLEKVIQFGIKIFYDLFHYNILNLLEKYPKDFLNKDGSKFWEGTKRMPIVLNFDINEENTFKFIKSLIFILSKIVNKTEINYSNEEIKKIYYNIKKSNDFERKNNNENLLKEVINKASLIKDLINNLEPEIFEKDNDLNNHINFIQSTSNLRALNYNIPCSDYETTKKIAGRIIPAIVSTTASITGLVCLQIYNIIQSKNRKTMRSSNINLGYPFFDLYFPNPKIYIEEIEKKSKFETKHIPNNFTSWDKIEIKGPLSAKEFYNYFKNNYNADISYLNEDNICIFDFNEESDEESEEDNFSHDNTKTIEELHSIVFRNEISKSQKYLTLNISGYIGEKIISTPIIKYILKI